jgi:hypothetical protein
MGDAVLVDRYTITKNIAKHGKNSIIVIPSILNSELQPRTTVKVTIEVIKRPESAADIPDDRQDRQQNQGEDWR